MNGIRLKLVLMVFGLWVLPVAGQRAPDASHVYPPVGKPGTRVDVVLAATDLTPDSRFFLLDPRLKLEVSGPPGPVLMPEPPYWLGIKSYLNDPNLTREVTARITIPADMPEGLVRWGVANASGVGELGQFLILDSSPVREEENRTGPQVLSTLPVDVCGRLARIEEQDAYQITATHTGMFTCELMARRLGSDFLGVLQVLDEAGRVVAEQFDTAGIDPVVSFPVIQGKKYTVSLRDVDYRGYRKFGYLLRFQPGPRVISASPSGGKRGETRTVTFHGVGLVSGGPKVESVSRQIRFPDSGERFGYVLETPQGKTGLYSFPLGDALEVVAPERDAVRLQVPGNHTAAFVQGSRTFVWTGKKGDMARLQVHPLDVHAGQDLELVVQGPDGKTVQQADDGNGSLDPHLVFTAPVDGAFQLVVRDRAGAGDGPGKLIRLEAGLVPPDFTLEVQNTLSFPVGASGALPVKVVRQGGFKEPVTLRVEPLPPGVTVGAAQLVVPPTVESQKLEMTSAKNGAAESFLARITGKAVVQGKVVEKTAAYPAFKALTPWPVASIAQEQVVVATTLKPPFKIKPLEADGGRRVNRGATHLAELAIERDKDFQGEIVLDMAARQQRHRQGIRGPELKVAPGVNKIHYPVFLPEGLETSRTSRIGLIARAQVKDPAGNTRWVTGDVEGQITMSIEGALLKLTGPSEVEISASGNCVIPLQWQRSGVLKEPARLELEVPAAWAKYMHANAVTLPVSNQGSVPLKISFPAGKVPKGEFPVTARLSTMRDGFPVVSEAVIQIISEGK